MSETKDKKWCPDFCPITRLEFFGWIEHPELGLVPTYGGPYDCYTIPEMGGEPSDKWHDRELFRERFDCDEGAWVGVEAIDARIVHERELIDRGFWDCEESDCHQTATTPENHARPERKPKL